MPVSRTNFRAGDRVRGADWFDEIAGAVATVVEAVEVRGHDWATQDLLVRFDRLSSYLRRATVDLSPLGTQL